MNHVDTDERKKWIPRKGIRMGSESVSNNERQKEDVGDEDE